jgi:biopolymer transport protein ExbD
MSPKKTPIRVDDDKVDLTPMIDVVFLLLVYFLWTTDLVQESDIGITLPANVEPDPSVELPTEHIVDIEASGTVLLNGVPMDNPDSRGMDNLVRTLKRLRLASEDDDRKMAVTIIASPSSLHQRSIDVLNACVAAEVKLVSFGES